MTDTTYSNSYEKFYEIACAAAASAADGDEYEAARAALPPSIDGDGDGVPDSEGEEWLDEIASLAVAAQLVEAEVSR